MAGDEQQPKPMRVLALYCTPAADEADEGFDLAASPNVQLLSGRPGVELEVVRGGTLDAFAARVEAFKPTLVYVSGPFSSLIDSIKGTVGPVTLGGGGAPVTTGELVTALEACSPLPETVFLDAAGQERAAELLRQKGVANVLLWSEDPSGLVSAHFSACFFAALSLEAHVTTLEAYALALFATQAHLGAKVDGRLTMPNMPDLLTGPLDDPDAVSLALPDNGSVPPLTGVPGVDPARPLAESVDGWLDVRLLAPRAELRLQVAGGSGMVDASRLSYVGEALRALLVVDARRARVVSSAPPTRPPSHLQPGCSALCCDVATSSGATVRVVLGARPELLANPALVEHAVRQTLVTDALSLQFRLPPPGVPPPLPRASGPVLGGCPVVDTLLLTSVWAVTVLRQLALKAQYRGLTALGVGAVGGAPVAGCRPADAARFSVIVTGLRSGVMEVEELLANGLPADGIGASLVGGGAPTPNNLAVPADPPIVPHACGRTPLSDCTEEEFMADLVSFLSHRRGRAIERGKFPEATLNGIALDLFTLYKEVVGHGGFRAGNAINWKGAVFGRMRNWTANNRQTGVGNSLKRHYATYLWEYEQAHAGDVTIDRCNLCGRGEEAGATDWIACDACNTWVHFSCDRRPNLGTFEDYAEAEVPRQYTCPVCARASALRVQKAAMAAPALPAVPAAAAAAAAPMET